MGVHKKPGMNTARAAVNCGLIFFEKEVKRALPQPAAVTEHRATYELFFFKLKELRQFRAMGNTEHPSKHH